MSAPITLNVVGLAAPQGSKTKMPNGAMVESASATGRAKLVEWRRAVADAARKATAEHGTVAEPVSLRIFVRLPSPKSDPYRTLHASKPDASKLARAVEDALVHGGLLKDDAMVCSLVVNKEYARPFETPGAQIVIYRRGADEARSRQVLKEVAAAERRAKKETLSA